MRSGKEKTDTELLRKGKKKRSGAVRKDGTQSAVKKEKKGPLFRAYNERGRGGEDSYLFQKRKAIWNPPEVLSRVPAAADKSPTRYLQEKICPSSTLKKLGTFWKASRKKERT